MSEMEDWNEILRCHYQIFNIEASIYIDVCSEGGNYKDVAKRIVETLCPGDVPNNLLKLYHEAVVGKNKKVAAKIQNCVYHIGRSLR